jgi:hypothetical protein
MKRILILGCMLISALSCRAQSPVYDISDIKNGPKGSYYKDIHGVLDGYDGTYLYTNGATSLKFILKKKVMSKGYYYKDLIIGEFQYIENGVELNNTLANIDVKYTDEQSNHCIMGYMILTGTQLGCSDCSPTEKRLRLSFVDNKSKNIAGIDIRKTTVNGIEALKVKIWWDDIIIVKEGDPAPAPGTLRPGQYIMIKQ